ncbi:fumarylacetoacetate hydrolase family protein [Pseudoalteromonas neustonica]|uniref:Fumarylacetoacetate hydrolase family protein n=1 Tax=Pseudoalteromonas neustonica TaxID=1840331 RepID=A0ABU9U2J5_9GAMM
MNTILCATESISPNKVVCIGRNFAAHIAELGNETPTELLLFIKPNSAISTNLKSHHNDDELHFETELCFLVQNNRLAAVGIGLDLTKRDVQTHLKSKGLPWERAKAFDGSAVFSEFVLIDDSKAAFSFSLNINGQVQQQGDCELMITKPDAIFAQISEFMTLQDGDIIMTGTPAGVAVVNAGSEFVAQLYLSQQLLLEQRWLAV